MLAEIGQARFQAGGFVVQVVQALGERSVVRAGVRLVLGREVVSGLVAGCRDVGDAVGSSWGASGGGGMLGVLRVVQRVPPFVGVTVRRAGGVSAPLVAVGDGSGTGSSGCR